MQDPSYFIAVYEYLCTKENNSMVFTWYIVEYQKKERLGLINTALLPCHILNTINLQVYKVPKHQLVIDQSGSNYKMVL
jgi:hypothetical protein